VVLDKGIIMHKTLSNNFIGYIDNFYVENGNLRISGWLVTTHERSNVVYYLDIGHNIAFYNFNERQDVSNFYGLSNENYLKCGFDISIPVPNNNNIQLFALVSGKKEVIFQLDLNQANMKLVETSLMQEPSNISISKKIVPSVIVVDNFYENPDEVRRMALEQNFDPDLRYHKGKRTKEKFIAQNTKQIFESLIGRKITRWTEFEYNGIFQYCTAEDPLVYHSDVQSYAAAVYLTPDAPVTTGTSFFRSRQYPNVYKSHVDDSNYGEIFKGGFYDKTKFELVDTIGNVYNRLALWDARLIHSATEYFGTKKEDSRLFHLFFFDIEE
jgi:hypothetical protein